MYILLEREVLKSYLDVTDCYSLIDLLKNESLISLIITISFEVSYLILTLGVISVHILLQSKHNVS